MEQGIANHPEPKIEIRTITDQKTDASLIAKMDASNTTSLKVVGQFWLVPVIAKIDASKNKYNRNFNELRLIAKMDSLDCIFCPW